MNELVPPMLRVVSPAENINWRMLAVALLPVRFIQGFIYWGGGSRRFIYAPAKLDPSAPHWMANKFQSAMPGAILGTDHIIAWLLQHFAALYVGLIVFSALELLCGLGLMAGFMTRLSAFGSLCFSIVLMLMFGWQGATCIDEWTMAACNLAMGATLMLAGAGAYSLDNLLLARNPQLADRSWFRWVSGALPLPLSSMSFVRLSIAVFAATVVFNVGTYNYYRGSVLTPFHEGPTNPSKHHFSLTPPKIMSDGSLSFHLSLDGGTPEAPAHVMEVVLQDFNGKPIETWNSDQLAHLREKAIHNDFSYNQIKAGRYGLSAEMGASATIYLPTEAGNVPGAGPFKVVVTDIEGKSFSS
jgi:uncharacterized membrane protein YphA (DoxX/SURF4 family)